eukprot:1144128-Pelagomonas_calceolata.AAC.5
MPFQSTQDPTKQGSKAPNIAVMLPALLWGSSANAVRKKMIGVVYNPAYEGSTAEAKKQCCEYTAGLLQARLGSLGGEAPPSLQVRESFLNACSRKWVGRDGLHGGMNNVRSTQSNQGG